MDTEIDNITENLKLEDIFKEKISTKQEYIGEAKLLTNFCFMLLYTRI